MSLSTPPPGPIRDLPIWDTVTGAYRTVFGQPDVLARAVLVPFVFSTVLTAAPVFVQSPALWNAVPALNLIPYTLFAVAWHRVSLMGAAGYPRQLLVRWSRRHWRFLFFSLLFMVTGFMAFMLAAQLALGSGPAAAMLITLLVAVGLTYVFLRLSFVFPALAVGEAYGLAHSWNHTRRQGVKLWLAAVLASLPLVFLLTFLYPLVMGALTGGLAQPLEEGATSFEVLITERPFAFIMAQLVFEAFNYFSAAVFVSLLSIAFRTLTGWVPAVAPPPAVPEKDGEEE